MISLSSWVIGHCLTELILYDRIDINLGLNQGTIKFTILLLLGLRIPNLYL